MRELVYFVAASVDGFIAAPDGSHDAFPIEGDHIDAIVADYADALPTHVLAALGASPTGVVFDTVIQGRTTYEIALNAGIDRPYAHLREYVVSRSLKAAPDGVTVTDDPLATVRELKREAGSGIYLCGGGVLAGALIEEIDRMIVKRNPVLLGEGIPLFAGVDAQATPLKLASARIFDSGVIFEQYERAA